MHLNRYIIVAILLSIGFTSCEKAETPIVLPPSNGSQMASVSQGINYENQIFFDFESNTVVKTSQYTMWDLAFEASKDGYHVFMNGGKNVFVYNTGKGVWADVATGYQYGVKDGNYSFDAPCGLPDSTGIGEWRDANGDSKKEIYLIYLKRTNSYKKIIINSVSENSYSLTYGDMSGNEKTIEIPKDDNFNYAYFSFDNGGSIVSPEPPKATWDIVFTYYRYIYRHLENFPYLVSGALLNPYSTTALADSISGYANITYNLVKNKPFSNHRDVIGFDWKDVKIDVGSNSATYSVKPEKCYVIKTRKNQYWKLHFIGFYDNNGVKGNPSFEFERLQ